MAISCRLLIDLLAVGQVLCMTASSRYAYRKPACASEDIRSAGGHKLLKRRQACGLAAWTAWALSGPSIAVEQGGEVWVPLSGDVASRPELARATVEKVYGRRGGELADYLARVLLSYDPFSLRWWKAQQTKDDELFSEFAASVELSMARAWESRSESPTEVLRRLEDRFSNATVRRHLAVAFSLVDNDNQPTSEISALLKQTRQYQIDGAIILNGGEGYQPNATGLVVAVGGRRIGTATADENGTIASVQFGRVLLVGDDDNATVEAQSAVPAAISIQKSLVPFDVVPRGYFFSQGPPGFDATPRLAAGRYRPALPEAGSSFEVNVFIERDDEPTLAQFGEIALCGALCASSAHIVLTPVEVAKTRAQLGDATCLSLADFFVGADAVGVGHFFAGACGFGLTALLKTKLNSPYAVVAASLAASVVSTIVVAPFESARVKCMAAPALRLRLGQAWRAALADQAPLEALFGALDALLLKDLSFAVVKFSAFDAFTNLLYSRYPFFKASLATSLLASLLAGTIAGVLAALVSQPADAAFTRLEAAPDASRRPSGVFQALTAVYRDKGFFKGLYAGALERAVFAGGLIALEFLVFEALKDALHVASDDFAYSLDVLASATAVLPPPSPF